MKKQEVKITRFEVTEKFFVEVENTGEVVEFHLCHKGYGIKEFMFGIMPKDITEDDYEDFIERNVFCYIPIYLKDREREENFDD